MNRACGLFLGRADGRIKNLIEELIVESIRWVFFEPNDRPLWQAIRRGMTVFLMDLVSQSPITKDGFISSRQEVSSPSTVPCWMYWTMIFHRHVGG